MSVITYNKDGIPVINGIIEIKKNFRDQLYTSNGYNYDEVISAVQKCIRRGLVNDALFWAKEIYDMGRPFRSNLINRLKIIASEDIGIANSIFVHMLKSRLDEPISERSIMGIVKAACLSPKSRLCSSIIHAVMDPKPKNYPKKLERFKYKIYKRKQLFPGKRSDTDRFKACMNSFTHALRKKDEKSACYWAQKVFEIKNYNKSARKKFEGKSKDPIYGLWIVLLNEKLRGLLRDSYQIIRSLLYFFDDRKNGRVERVFLVHAILYLCNLPNTRESMWNIISDDHQSYFDINDELWGVIQEHKMIPMLTDAIDNHTRRGRERRNGSKHFCETDTKLVNVPDFLKTDPYLEVARGLNMQRDNEKMKPRIRKLNKKIKPKRRREDENNKKKKKKKVKKLKLINGKFIFV